jgi:hypothetical protein
MLYLDREGTTHLMTLSVCIHTSSYKVRSTSRPLPSRRVLFWRAEALKRAPTPTRPKHASHNDHGNAPHCTFLLHARFPTMAASRRDRAISVFHKRAAEKKSEKKKDEIFITNFSLLSPLVPKVNCVSLSIRDLIISFHHHLARPGELEASSRHHVLRPCYDHA